MLKNILNVDVTRPNQELVIMRGIPGCGKSTKAKTIVNEGVIHSTDDLIESTRDYNEFFNFMNENDAWHLLGQVHMENYENAKKSLKSGKTPVIIDNTNLSPKECKPYVKYALKLGLSEANIKIIDLGTSGLNAKQLSERNTHGVPLEKIDSMINKHTGNGPLTVEKIMEAKDEILYCSVVLNNQAKRNLLNVFDGSIPEGWTVFAHHMTIRFGGGLSDDLKSDLGLNVTLEAYEVGYSDMAMAVKVRGYYSKNVIPHITVAVNTPDGGKPVMSNNIIDWSPITPIRLQGVVTEIPKHN